MVWYRTVQWKRNWVLLLRHKSTESRWISIYYAILISVNLGLLRVNLVWHCLVTQEYLYQSFWGEGLTLGSTIMSDSCLTCMGFTWFKVVELATALKGYRIVLQKLSLHLRRLGVAHVLRRRSPAHSDCILAASVRRPWILDQYDKEALWGGFKKASTVSSPRAGRRDEIAHLEILCLNSDTCPSPWSY
jgi:hypothetical protein